MVPALKARMLLPELLRPPPPGRKKVCPVQQYPHRVCMATISFSVTSRFGSPAVIKGMKHLRCFLKAAAILLMQIHPHVSCNGCYVFIAAAGNIYYDNFIFRQSRRQLLCIGNSMSAFNSWNNAFRSGKIAERRYRFVVSCRYILRTPAIIKSRMFRPYAG